MIYQIQSLFYYLSFICIGLFYLWLPSHKTALTHTGYLSFGLFFFLLSLNPIIKRFPKLRLAHSFNCFRREIGLGSFWFLCIHIYATIQNTISQVGNFPIIALFVHPVIAPGFVATLIFLALAITSNDLSIARLGVPRWKQLHRYAYIAQWLVFVHIVLQPVWGTVAALVICLPAYAVQRYRHRVENFQNLTPAWEGFRPLVVTEKRKEGVEGIYTFYLKDPKRKRLPAFHPGQYLTIAFDIPGISEPVVRAYSLSDWRARPTWYRFTIKQVLADKAKPESQDGLVSNYLANTLQEGTILQVKAPQGHFILDPKDDKLLVLIGGGIGVTPMLSMIPGLLLTHRKRQFWFFYSVKDRDFEYLRDDMVALEARYPGFHRHVFYSSNDAEIQGHSYHRSRITVEKMKEILPNLDFDFYICGPTGMIQNLVKDLEVAGVPQQKIHYETFDHSTFIKRQGTVQESCEVLFKRSGVKTTWTPTDGTLQQLAKKNGIQIPVNCRMGNCGRCAVSLNSGRVAYSIPPTAQVAENQCLTCISAPGSDLELDC